jgi:hypothetical protein
MEQKDIELITSQVYLVETSDIVDTTKPKRAIIRIPIISEGANSKNLLWTEETMQKVADKFRGVPFRYDLNGQNEGSHTKEHLSSPFYDVGWTYSDERGANYDPSTKTIWVQGEVTNPEVIDKLSRTTSEGKREINFASMGAMIKPEDTECSICGKHPFGTCQHERGKEYNGQMCSMVPTDIAKALHVALTNDPADKNAEIAEAIFQDMNEIADNTAKDSPVSPAPNTPGPSNQDDLKSLIKTIIEEYLSEKKKVETADDVKEDVKMEDDKKKKKKDDDVKEEKKEDVEKEAESGKNTEKASLKVEKADDHKEPDEDNKGGPSDHDEDNEKEDSKKKKGKKKDESEEKSEDKKEMADDDVEFKISGVALEKPKMEFQDNSDVVKVQKAPIVETASNDIYATKYKNKLLLEIAEDYVKYNKAKSRDEAVKMLNGKTIEQLEIYQEAFDGLVVTEAPVTQKAMPVFQDNNHTANRTFVDEVPEFGGAEQEMDPYVEFQDLSPDERAKQFGNYGAFDMCFNPHNATKYRK